MNERDEPDFKEGDDIIAINITHPYHNRLTNGKVYKCLKSERNSNDIFMCTVISDVNRPITVFCSRFKKYISSIQDNEFVKMMCSNERMLDI